MDELFFSSNDFNKERPFYSESFKKRKERRGNGVLQLVLVALLSSILTGAVFFTVFRYVAPAAVKPSGDSYFSNIIPEKNNKETGGAENSDASKSVKPVEIKNSGNEGDLTVTEIAEKVSPSIVGIRVTAKVRNYFFGDTEARGEGSGIIKSSDGYIITNYHVIEYALDNSGRQRGNAKIEVFLSGRLDKPYIAEVKGVDYWTDLAVLKINATGLPYAELGDSDKLKVGELAVAIGNPGGLELMGSVTVGVISGLNREIQAENQRAFKLIQTDAAINPGNSGGALVNSKGQVIGVNTVKMVANGYEGLGFAIPINTVKQVINDLIEYNYVKGRPLLGIRADSTYNEAVARYYNLPAGVRVEGITPLSGAEKAGIQVGDIITKFNGKQVKSLQELNELKNKFKPGDKVTLEIYRNGRYMNVTVTLTEDQG